MVGLGDGEYRLIREFLRGLFALLGFDENEDPESAYRAFNMLVNVSEEAMARWASSPAEQLDKEHGGKRDGGGGIDG